MINPRYKVTQIVYYGNMICYNCNEVMIKQGYEEKKGYFFYCVKCKASLYAQLIENK